MRQCHVAAVVAVRPPLAEREAGAGGGQRREAEALQIARAADVPGFGSTKQPVLCRSWNTRRLSAADGRGWGHE